MFSTGKYLKVAALVVVVLALVGLVLPALVSSATYEGPILALVLAIVAVPLAILYTKKFILNQKDKQ